MNCWKALFVGSVINGFFTVPTGSSFFSDTFILKIVLLNLYLTNKRKQLYYYWSINGLIKIGLLGEML